MTSFSRSKRLSDGPFRGRRSRRGLSMVGVTLGMIIAVTLLDNSVTSARIAIRARIAAGRAQGLLLAAHDLDANLASLVRQGQTAFLASIPANTAVSVTTLPTFGVVLPTGADAPFGALPATWTVKAYVANISTAAGSLPYGLLYIKLPTADAAMMPALKTALFAHAATTASLEAQSPDTLIAQALNRPLDPATELAVYTAPFAGLDPAAVLRAPRAGWSNAPMTVPLDMGGHDMTSTSAITGQSASATTLATTDLSARAATIGGTLTTPVLGTTGPLATKDMTLGSLSAVDAQITTLSANAMSADTIVSKNAVATSLAAPEAAATGTLSLPGVSTASTGAVNNLASPETGGPGTVATTNTQANDGLAATSATLKHLTVQTCNGC